MDGGEEKATTYQPAPINEKPNNGLNKEVLQTWNFNLLLEPNKESPRPFEIIGANNNTFYGIMVVLPISYKEDYVMTLNFNNAQEQGLPILLVTDVQSFADGMKALKDKGVSAFAYSIHQHGNAGYTQIGNEVVTYKTDFSVLREGLSDRNVFLHSCRVTLPDGTKNGEKLITAMANQTNANMVVAADHTVDGGKWTNTSLNEKWELFSWIMGGSRGNINDFSLAKPNEPVKKIYDFTMRPNGIFVWKVNDSKP